MNIAENDLDQTDTSELNAELIDQEDTKSHRTQIKPWDPGKIRINTKAFSLRDVVSQIQDGDIDLAPDFQRDFVWKRRQRTRLIESILLGIPLPAFYFNQRKDGTYQVVDGVQRLSTIALFMNDGEPLNRDDLEYLDDLDGAIYSTLDPSALRRFRTTQIVVHVIEPQTPDEVKYDIFNRVNTLGSPLSAQEIRHAISRDKSRNFLKDLSEFSSFDIATEWQFWRRNPEGGDKIRDSGRMTNRELALRFCAFKNYSELEYRKFSSLDAFLIEFTRSIDGTSEIITPLSDLQLEQLRADFGRAMENATAVLGRAAFRRWPLEQSRRGPINRAVFEAQAIALSKYPLKGILPKAEEIVRSLRAAFSVQEYARSVTVGTGDPNSVTRRLEYTDTLLSEALK